MSRWLWSQRGDLSNGIVKGGEKKNHAILVLLPSYELAERCLLEPDLGQAWARKSLLGPESQRLALQVLTEQ